MLMEKLVSCMCSPFCYSHLILVELASLCNVLGQHMLCACPNGCFLLYYVKLNVRDEVLREDDDNT